MKALFPPLVAILLLSVSSRASAQSIITNDADSPSYTWSLEPHGVFTPFSPPNGYTDIGVGAGVYAAINVAERGFLPTVNDSVAILFGLDFISYDSSGATTGECQAYVGDGDARICVSVAGGSAGGSYFYLPAAMQWNFHFSEAWTVFGEPGLALYFWSPRDNGGVKVGLSPVFNLGGKWNFSRLASLTLRVGYPASTVGVELKF